MTSSNENSAVKIAVRECPARGHLTNLESSVVTCHPNGTNIIVNETVFKFDYILGSMVTQKEIFDKLMKPLVTNLKLGFNCTALAYGQTGTGKSYTMGLNSKSLDGENVGVIPRCLNEIFSTNETISPDHKGKENYAIYLQKNEISVSFIEIYNEKVYDLLANTNEPIVARGYKYTGGTRKPIKNLEDCYAILMHGNKNRHVRPTKMNLQSSRSHAIFTIHYSSVKQLVTGEEIVTKSSLNIVDLAGSEGVRRTGHQGMAMSEGVHINQGLLSIGKVLQAITTGSKVIPYRDSVLSSVLQESLNSNSYLTLLACVSPHREDLSETLSTLRFAQNAKLLKHMPEINNVTKKNIKLKQTPYKGESMQLNNVKATPLKRCYSTLYGTQAKSTVKSHTFCTPKKKKIDVNKCNQTAISSAYNRPKLSHVQMNLPKMTQFESTHNQESLFTKSIDSNGSLMSLNISASTAIDGHANNRNTNFSPIIRKCMTELKNDLEENIIKMFQTNLNSLIPQTPAPASARQNETVLPSTIRQELKSIMKEILSENYPINGEEVSQNNTTTTLNAKCQLFNSSDELFKIPEVPLECNKPKTSSPISENQDCSTASVSFSKTFFSGATNKTVLNKYMRRSYRALEQQQHEQSISADDSMSKNANHSLRRSSRTSVLQMYQNKRESIRLALNESLQDQNGEEESIKSSKIVKKSNKAKQISLTNNTVIDGYYSGSMLTTNKTSLNKHRKAVLDLLNNGTMKALQILPQVGQKTAYLIVTQRTLSGKFKNWTQVEKLPIWRGSAWERFAKANMII